MELAIYLNYPTGVESIESMVDKQSSCLHALAQLNVLEPPNEMIKVLQRRFVNFFGRDNIGFLDRCYICLYKKEDKL